ncbi:hypothetical protein L6452_25724 [Arctium lappa]|uniref:Uncharacterized protein n=1 Tax=Arctium lappa TaxID=4217 RepID=A0ACB9AAZ2_ARCLA|nr:hypothetical protein L6452_25724 [Arctium lappa]
MEPSDTYSPGCKILVVSRIKFSLGSDENMIKQILEKCKRLPLALKVKSLHLRGLGLIPGVVGRFDSSNGCRVPHIGWNALQIKQDFVILDDIANRHVCFVHSYRTIPWKFSDVGLSILRKFLLPNSQTKVIACLDVRTNDNGDLVVLKGDQYDVREQTKENEVIPLHLPPGDTSTERTVQIDGSNDQIEAAKQMVNEVISEGNQVTGDMILVIPVLQDTISYDINASISSYISISVYAIGCSFT